MTSSLATWTNCETQNAGENVVLCCVVLRLIEFTFPGAAMGRQQFAIAQMENIGGKCQ